MHRLAFLFECCAFLSSLSFSDLPICRPEPFSKRHLRCRFSNCLNPLPHSTSHCPPTPAFIRTTLLRSVKIFSYGLCLFFFPRPICPSEPLFLEDCSIHAVSWAVLLFSRIPSRSSPFVLSSCFFCINTSASLNSLRSPRSLSVAIHSC